MPNTAQLKARSHELDELVSSILSDDKLTAAEKSAKLDDVETDVEAHRVDIKNSARASEWRAQLGAGAEAAADIKEGFAEASTTRGYLPTTGRLDNIGIAREWMGGKSYSDAIKAIGGKDGLGARGRVNELLELGVKANDAASNLMGESFTGTGAAAALGQNPFFAGSAGAGIMPHWVPGIVEQRFYKLTIPDLFSNVATDAPGISYLVEATANFNSDIVAEKGAYPFSSETLSRVYEQVGKVANAMKLTDEAIRDAPQFFSFVQGRLTMGVQRKEEVALLAGAGGTGVNGLLNRSATFTKPQVITAVTNVSFPPASTPGAGVVPNVVASLTYGRKVAGASTGVYPTGQVIANEIFKAITDIAVGAFCDVTAIVMNPYDWQIIRLATDTAGQYLGGSFFGTNYGNGQDQGTLSSAVSGNAETLWGRRVVTSPLMPQGTILVGSFGPDVANVYRRQGLTVEMTNSDGTDFENGIVTVRAESRLALAVYRPAGFELIQLVVGP